MKALTKLRELLESTDKQKLHLYLAIMMLSIMILAAFIVIQNRRSVSFWLHRIRVTNDLREQVRDILDRAERVHQQRLEVDELLAQDENFKISGYFQEVITKLGLADKKTESESTSVERDENYRADVLTAKFSGITMRECVELLQEFEQNQRIYTNELDIKRSKKVPQTIDIVVSIATLQPRAQAGITE